MLGNKEKAKAPDLGNKRNQIENGTKITGDILTVGTIRVDGEVEGSLVSESKVVLGPTSQLNGSLKAQNAEVAGNVKGTIEISELLTLKSTAVIDADVVTNKIYIEEGAVFNGTTKMGAIVKDISAGEKKHEGQGKQKLA